MATDSSKNPLHKKVEKILNCEIDTVSVHCLYHIYQ